MIGVVQRRPHQFGHAGIDDHEFAHAFRGLISITRASSTPAGPTIERPGSITIGSPVGRTSSTSASTYSRGRRAPRGRRTKSPVRRRHPRIRARRLAAEFDRHRRDEPRRAAQRLQAGHLRSDVHVHRDQFQRRPSADRREQLARGIDRHAELVDLQTRWKCADGSWRRCPD